MIIPVSFYETGICQDKFIETMTYELDKSQYDGSVFIWSDPCLEDTDGDGLDDKEEREAGTNPRLVDTDGDDIYPLKKYWHWNSNWTKDNIFAFNYEQIVTNNCINQQLDTDDFIYGQKSSNVSNMLYGVSRIANVGCELIAIYNATKMLGSNQNLSEIIYEFEMNPRTKYWLDLINCGRLGTQPELLGGYLSNHGYSYEYTEDLETLELWKKRVRVFYNVILVQ